MWQCQIQISTPLHLAAINFRKLLLELQPELPLRPASEKPGLVGCSLSSKWPWVSAPRDRRTPGIAHDRQSGEVWCQLPIFCQGSVDVPTPRGVT